MHNSIDPLYSAKKVKDMSPTEKKNIKKKQEKSEKKVLRNLFDILIIKK